MANLPDHNHLIRRSRAPQGAGRGFRTFIALLPQERAELERLAELDNRTWSAMGRIFLVRGMKTDPNYRDEVVAQSTEDAA